MRFLRRNWPKSITTLHELMCPECQSISLINRGRRKNMTDYICADCGRECFLLIEGRHISLAVIRSRDEL